MVGGDAEDVAKVQPIFDALKPEGDGFVHAGPVGAGHFAKMVHNGIEYGMMQAYAEGYELLRRPTSSTTSRRHPVWPRAPSSARGCSTCSCWRSRRTPSSPSSAATSRTPARAGGPSRRRSTTPSRCPVITAALFARFASRQDDSPAMKAVAALRNQFGGHAVQPKVGRGDEVEKPASAQPVPRCRRICR